MEHEQRRNAEVEALLSKYEDDDGTAVVNGYVVTGVVGMVLVWFWCFC